MGIKTKIWYMAPLLLVHVVLYDRACVNFGVRGTLDFTSKPYFRIWNYLLFLPVLRTKRRLSGVYGLSRLLGLYKDMAYCS